MKILGNKIVRKISGENFISNDQNKKLFSNNVFNYNNDFNFEYEFNSSQKDIFLSFENFNNENNIDIFGGENSISSMRKNSLENFNILEQQKIEKKEKEQNHKEKGKEKDNYLSEINDLKNTEKLLLLKDLLSSKKYIEGSIVKSIDDNDNTTVSTKKTKEKMKNILTKENIDDNNNINIISKDFNLSLGEEKNKKKTKDKLNNYNFDTIFSEKITNNNNSNISFGKNIHKNNKESNKIFNDLLETAKYFNLNN